MSQEESRVRNRRTSLENLLSRLRDPLGQVSGSLTIAVIRPTSATTDPIASAVADLPPLVTRQETAKFLRSSKDHVSRLVRSGELLAVQRRVRTTAPILIPRESIRNYLERTAL